uniref:Uncharacterized protein n=1 Tax=Arundo donax TaxID=35708 RepID=A0A0A8ZLW9_ARUDO
MAKRDLTLRYLLMLSRQYQGQDAAYLLRR